MSWMCSGITGETVNVWNEWCELIITAADRHIGQIALCL